MKKNISLEGLEAAKRCDSLYLDSYTSVWGGLEGLQSLTGKTIQKAQRSDLEEDVSKIVEKAKEADVGIIVPGDPMVATTHSTIVMEAKRQKVDFRIIHSSSIVSAAAESGLHIYKFGKVVSIPYPQDNYKPETFYDNIKSNKNIGLHTLVLLDIQNGTQMKPSEAISILKEIEEKRKECVIETEDYFVVCSFRDKTQITYEKTDKIKTTE